MLYTTPIVFRLPNVDPDAVSNIGGLRLVVDNPHIILHSVYQPATRMRLTNTGNQKGVAWQKL